MKLLIRWDARSPRLDRQLGSGWPYRCGPVGRLTQHRPERRTVSLSAPRRYLVMIARANGR